MQKHFRRIIRQSKNWQTIIRNPVSCKETYEHKNIDGKAVKIFIYTHTDIWSPFFRTAQSRQSKKEAVPSLGHLDIGVLYSLLYAPAHRSSGKQLCAVFFLTSYSRFFAPVFRMKVPQYGEGRGASLRLRRFFTKRRSFTICFKALKKTGLDEDLI